MALQWPFFNWFSKIFCLKIPKDTYRIWRTRKYSLDSIFVGRKLYYCPFHVEYAPFPVNFYFLSEAPKFKDSFFLWFFSNLQISMVLTISLHIMDILIIKYDMMIYFSVFFSVSVFFPYFSGFSSNLQIFSQNGLLTCHELHDYFLFLKFYRFPDFSAYLSYL